VKDSLIDISECLFHAFANPDYSDPQDEQQMWAIREGVKRIDRYSREWHKVRARKEHECERGCKIRKRDTYFSFSTGPGWGTELKFCAGCTAMILYFREVEKLPPYVYSHWDRETKKPVRVKDLGDPQHRTDSEAIPEGGITITISPEVLRK
jgi:hypothetical protein